MKVLLLDDLRHPTTHEYRLKALGDMLEEARHTAVYYDGHDAGGAPIRDPYICATRVKAIMDSNEINALVVDLRWFDQEQYGIDLIVELKAMNKLPHVRDVVVLTNNAYPAAKEKLAELGIEGKQVFVHRGGEFKRIVDWFSR